MAENEGMEGKDLAQDEKLEFEAKILQVIDGLKNGHTSISTEGLEVQNFGGQYVLRMRGIEFGIIKEDGDSNYSFTYSKENFARLKQVLQEEGLELDELGLPDIEQAIDQEEKAKKEQEEQDQEQDGDEEEQDEEKGDENPELEEDKEEVDEKKEEIAKQYGVNSNQVIHIAKHKKITREDFGQIAKWANDYDDIFIVPGEDEFSRKFIGSNDGKQEEIEAAEQTVRGKNPDISLKRIDGDKITEVRPLAMYKLDNKSSIAIVRDQYGQPEALYCREQAGDKKAYWGSVIPEASGKNVYQQDTKTRNFMDSKYNSGHDLDNKAEAMERQQDLEERGMPSKGEGVQREEIEGTYKQNVEHNIDDIVEDLMSRDGVMDKATVPDGYYDDKAKKVLAMMEGNEKMTFEEAIEKVEGENTREEGGRMPGDVPNDPRRGE